MDAATPPVVRVLVVTSNKRSRTNIRGFLMEFVPGVQVSLAANYEEVQQYLEHGRPDLITMGGNFLNGAGVKCKSGPLFVTQLRQAGVECSIIMVTDDQQTASEGLKNGASAWCKGTGISFLDEFRATLTRLGFVTGE